MPRFTPEKQNQIRERLLESGYDRFLADGLDATTIADLTDDAGIAAGTFYSFFDSKEELFATILRREAERVYSKCRTALRDNEDDPATAIRQFLEISSEAIAENPLFRRTISRRDRERIRAALPEAQLEATRTEKLSLLVPYLEEWQRQGLIVDDDPETIALAIIYVSYLPLHHDEMGEEQYASVRNVLFSWVSNSITT